MTETHQTHAVSGECRVEIEQGGHRVIDEPDFPLEAASEDDVTVETNKPEDENDNEDKHFMNEMIVVLSGIAVDVSARVLSSLTYVVLCVL